MSAPLLRESDVGIVFQGEVDYPYIAIWNKKNLRTCLPAFFC